MPTYCTTEDVLRELGGVRETIEERFDVRLWSGAVTSVTVDGLTFDMPDTILARIVKQIDFASSRLNTTILNAYKAEPAIVPAHLTQAAARIAAWGSCPTDGTRPQYLRDAYDDALTYFDKIAKMELDLGIVTPRPRHRAPAAYVARGVGSRPSRSSTSYGGGFDGCCATYPSPCDCS
jgi:phage gp36-like protein